MEDPALQGSRTAATAAVALGTALLALYGTYMHQVGDAVTKSNRFTLFVLQHLFEVCAVALQLSLLLVYIVWNNSMCETYGCTWGWGSTWLLLSQASFLMDIGVAYKA